MGKFRFVITTEVQVTRNDGIWIEAETKDEAVRKMQTPEFRKAIIDRYKGIDFVDPNTVQTGYDNESERSLMLTGGEDGTIYCMDELGHYHNLNPYCPQCGQELTMDEDGELNCINCGLYGLNNREVEY